MVFDDFFEPFQLFEIRLKYECLGHTTTFCDELSHFRLN